MENEFNVSLNFEEFCPIFNIVCNETKCEKWNTEEEHCGFIKVVKVD
jgi:hypothetical protein